MPIPKALNALGYFAAAAYVLIGAIGGLLLPHWESTSGNDQALWIGFLVGGAVLLLAGLRLLPRSPRGGAALISVGGFFGALPIFWTGIALLVGVMLVLLSVRYARAVSRANRVTD